VSQAGSCVQCERYESLPIALPGTSVYVSRSAPLSGWPRDQAARKAYRLAGLDWPEQAEGEGGVALSSFSKGEAAAVAGVGLPTPADGPGEVSTRPRKRRRLGGDDQHRCDRTWIADSRGEKDLAIWAARASQLADGSDGMRIIALAKRAFEEDVVVVPNNAELSRKSAVSTSRHVGVFFDNHICKWRASGPGHTLLGYFSLEAEAAEAAREAYLAAGEQMPLAKEICAPSGHFGAFFERSKCKRFPPGPAHEAYYAKGRKLPCKQAAQAVRDAYPAAGRTLPVVGERQGPGKRAGGTSRHRGVYFHKSSGRWHAREPGGQKHLGYFALESEAVEAVREAYRAAGDSVVSSSSSKVQVAGGAEVVSPMHEESSAQVSTRLKGVHLQPNGKWRADGPGKKRYLGCFVLQSDAAQAVTNAYLGAGRDVLGLHRGVHFHKRDCKWTARGPGPRRKQLGSFVLESEAAEVAREAYRAAGVE